MPSATLPKLAIGPVDDPLEREADLAAERAMRMPAGDFPTFAAQRQVSRTCEDCEEEERPQQTPTRIGGGADAALAIVHDVLRSPGRALDAGARAFFEPRFGRDFSGVRLHGDSQAIASARAVGAKAYTVGPDIVFGAAQSEADLPLLAHELAHVVQMQRQVGNHATALILARAPETWYRGEAPGIPRAKLGGSVHDLTDGLYFTDSAQAAQGYGDLRAGTTGGGNTLGASFDRRILGNVLDLPAYPQWARFLASKPPVSSMGSTWGEYMSRSTELYNNGFHEFLRQNKLQLTQYDAIIAEDLIRNPNAKQLVIINEKIAERVDDMLARIDVPKAPKAPGPGPAPGAAAPPGEPTAALSRGGVDVAGPAMEIEGARVKLYRAVGPDEVAELARHAEFGYSPHGGGKYFSFTKNDAINAAKKLYPNEVTLVETTLPRAYFPAAPDSPQLVHHPHQPARGGQSVMIEGEVMVFYDPRAGGWSLHVDDNALDVMNSQMTRPNILESTLPTVGAAPHGPVGGGAGGGGAHERLGLPPSAQSSGGGGGTLAPVSPRAQGAHGEVTPGAQGGKTVSGGGGATLAPTSPAARSTKGGITTTTNEPTNLAGGGPQAGPGVEPVEPAVAGGDPPTTAGSSVGTPKAGGILGKVGSVGLSMAAGTLEALSQYLIAKQVADFEEATFEQQMTALNSDIQRAVKHATPEIKKTLQDTNYHKTIYANIHMETDYVMAVFITRSGSSWRWAFVGLHFVGVDVSAQDIQRNDKSYTSGILPIWHRPFTYSVPIAEPAALVLPAIKVVHNMLAAIRTDLMAIRGGSAGEGAALDELTVAQAATDYVRPTVFQGRTGTERFHSTLNAIDTSLSVLQGPSGDNPAIENLRGRLWQVKFLLGGLAERWPIMVGNR